ncbi:MAG: barstar family protein [Candidatus Marithrix sp.]|nr:barstar family protein [Candidatus Marithrix sp.]
MNPAHIKNLTIQVSNKLSPIISNSFLIDGNVITNKESFFKEFNKKLQFPEYFGDNWDGFYDCITDLSWIKEDGSYLIIYENSFNFQSNNSENWKIANGILFEAVDYWKQQNQPMIIIFL